MSIKNNANQAFRKPAAEPSVADIQLFFEAVETEKPAAINEYLQDFPALLEHRDTSRGATPFIAAARMGNLGAVEFLHKKGADINAADNADMNALMNACERGEMAVAKYLVEVAGMDAAKTNRNGMTPASCAYGAEFYAMESRMKRYIEEQREAIEAQKEARRQAFNDEIDGMGQGTQRPLNVTKPLQLRLKF